MGLAEARDGGQLDIPVVELLVRAFMGDHLDAGFLGALEHRLQGGGVIRHDGDHIDLAGDEILDRAHLLGGVGLGRADLPGFDAQFRADLLDAGLHGVEPRNAADLHHGGDLRLGLRHRRAGKSECGRNRSGKF